MLEKTVQELYKERETRYITALDLGQPDRVPHESRFGVYWTLKNAGFPIKGNIVDAEKIGIGMEKIAKEIATDTVPGIFARNPLFYNTLGARSFVEGSNGVMQHPEVCSMEVEDYPAFIEDPFKCIIERVLPRLYTALDGTPSETMMTLTKAMQIKNDMTMPLLMEINRVSQKYGLPSVGGGLIEAPLDYVADQMRGFTKMSLDIRRHPEYVSQAAEAALGVMLKLATVTPPVKGKLISIPLHMPIFMSEKNFLKFFWPTFKKMVEILGEKGYQLKIYFEGDWTRFYDILQELPPKVVLGVFEYMDHKACKEKLGKIMCLSGGYDNTILEYGTKQEVCDKAKEVIDIMAPGGGFIFCVSKGIQYVNDGKAENVKALYETVAEYGKY